MKQKKSLQDTFNESTPFIGEKTSEFSRAFPTIDTLEVAITHEGIGRSSQYNVTHLSNGSMTEYVRCQNPSCYGGGLHIGEIVRDMTHRNQVTHRETRICNGHEGNSRRVGRDCFNHFIVKVRIKYIKGSLSYFSKHQAEKVKAEYEKYVGQELLNKEGQKVKVELLSIDEGPEINVNGNVEHGYYVMCEFSNGIGVTLAEMCAYNSIPYDMRDYDTYLEIQS